MSIKLEHLTVKRNGVNILEDLNFELKDDENCAIIGEIASGKSTLIEVLAGSIFPNKGEIKTTKKIIKVQRDFSYNRKLKSAFLYYQQRFNSMDAEIGPSLYEVLQNIIIPIYTTDLKSVNVPKASFSDVHLNMITDLFGIKHLLHQKITSLSNGETHKALLAQAFLQKPDVLLFDNPFLGLDADSQTELSELLNSLKNIQMVLVAPAKNIPKSFTKIIQIKNKKAEIVSINDQKTDKILADINWNALNINPNLAKFDIAFNLTNVSVKYGEKTILSDVNWQVKREEKWALQGANGTGKSTLLSLILGDNPQRFSNDIILFDKKSGLSIWDIKKNIGFISPEIHLYFEQNIEVWKVVASGFFDSAGLYKKLSNEQHILVDYWLEVLEMSTLKNRLLATLSSGEQRKVFLARALIKNPELIILDEPFQGLDYAETEYFKHFINQYVTKNAKTLIFVSHNVEDFLPCVNKIFKLTKPTTNFNV